jgi:hypothetical protein
MTRNISSAGSLASIAGSLSRIESSKMDNMFGSRGSRYGSSGGSVPGAAALDPDCVEPYPYSPYSIDFESYATFQQGNNIKYTSRPSSPGNLSILAEMIRLKINLFEITPPVLFGATEGRIRENLSSCAAMYIGGRG